MTQKRIIRESTVAAQLRRALKDPKRNPKRIIARKIQAMFSRGLPDYMLLCPGGVCVFLELKRPGGKTTALQDREHATLRARGFDVYVSSEPIRVLEIITAKLCGCPQSTIDAVVGTLK